MGYIVWQNDPLELEIRILISAVHFIILLTTVVLLNMQINTGNQGTLMHEKLGPIRKVRFKVGFGTQELD